MSSIYFFTVSSAWDTIMHSLEYSAIRPWKASMASLEMESSPRWVFKQALSFPRQSSNFFFCFLPFRKRTADTAAARTPKTAGKTE